MASPKTELTEIVTGLGTLGLDGVDAALKSLPVAMRHVTESTWERLCETCNEQAMALHVASAWQNGVAFLEAPDGLRGRIPRVVEWKGAHGNKGDSSVPADLRIDHVYLISCKYRSDNIESPSPYNLFEALLIGPRRMHNTPDWYQVIAAEQHKALYEIARNALVGAPLSADDLDTHQRKALATALRSEEPDGFVDGYAALIEVVANTSARRWNAQLSTSQMREQMLWRLLRLQSAPYFVLGESAAGSVRYRVATPWDWSIQYKFKSLTIAPAVSAGQPTVNWEAVVHDRQAAADVAVRGHVEVRWTHGKFNKKPEAKLYLDTAITAVPGYYPLA